MQNGQVHIWQSDAISYRFNERDFDAAYWLATDNAGMLQGGRGGSCRFQLEGGDYVLRQYLRGGLVQHFNRDSYLWTGLRNTRPACEQKVVSHAKSQGLPVPTVAAWQVVRRGFWYRAAIISEFIPHAATLAGWLGQQTLSAEAWSELGALIRRMHDTGIDHADLNADNILINQSADFHLIDFDRARMRPFDRSWAQGNLDRLLRSLHKIGQRKMRAEQPFHFTQGDWQKLLKGYR